MGSLGKSSQNVGVQSCYFNAIDHNVRGLSDGKLEELVRHMEDNNIFLVHIEHQPLIKHLNVAILAANNDNTPPRNCGLTQALTNNPVRKAAGKNNGPIYVILCA